MAEFTSNLSDYPNLIDSHKSNSWIMKGPHQNVEFRPYPAQTLVNYSRLGRTLSSDFEGLQGWRLHNCSGIPVSLSDHSHCKEVFHIFKWIFLYFNVCLVLSGKQWKDTGSMVFYYLNPFWYLHTLIRSTEPSFLQVNKSNSLSLSLYDTSSILLIIFVTFHWTFSTMGMYFLCWGAQNWTQISRCGLTSASLERRNYFPWPTGYAWLLLAAFSVSAHCWFIVDILPSRSPGSFSVKLLPRLQ